MQQTKDPRAGCLPLAWGGVILGGLIVAWLLVATVSRAPAPPPESPLVAFAGEALAVALRLFPVAVLAALGIAAWRWATRAGAERLQDGLLHVAALKAIHQTPQPHVYSPRIELEYGGERRALPPPTPSPTPEPVLAVVKPPDDWLAWLDEQPHTLLAGRTKAGKTWLATAILAQRLRAGESVFIIDPHSSDWLGLPTAGSAANPGELSRALGAVLGEYLRRMREREQHKQTTGHELAHDHFGRLTVVIDEANAIADEMPVEWKTVIKQVASGSRKVGIALLALAQSPLVEDLGISGGMRENFARIALDDRAVHMLIDRERDKARRDALRDALMTMDRPAAAPIGASIWLLDRRDMVPGTPPAAARSLVWHGWDFTQGRRVSMVSAATAVAGEAVPDVSHTPIDDDCNGAVAAQIWDVSSLSSVVISAAEAAKIATLLATLPTSEVVKRVDGYNGRNYREIKAKVEQVKAMLNEGGAS